MCCFMAFKPPGLWLTMGPRKAGRRGKRRRAAEFSFAARILNGIGTPGEWDIHLGESS